MSEKNFFEYALQSNKLPKQLTNKMVSSLVKEYAENQKELHKVDRLLVEKGKLENGVDCIYDTPEYGFHVAFEYVFRTLGINPSLVMAMNDEGV